MKALFAMVILVALSTASSAYGKELVIADLRAACKEITDDRAAPDNFKMGLCGGFLLGQAAWRDSACLLLQRGDNLDTLNSAQARNTQGHTLLALAQGFVNWANDHPELWSEKLIFTAVTPDFWSEFPCKAGN